MITVKEYAEQKGVSHQAVYKQLQTHAEELKPFIVMNGRTRMLTDEAVAILEQYRETNPQIIERTNDKERVEELENQIKIFLTRENELERKVAKLSEELKDAYKKDAENAHLIAEAESNKLLLQMKSDAYAEEKERADQLHLQNQQLQTELGTFKKTIFGFYKKEK